jgi:hypothetical protein
VLRLDFSARPEVFEVVYSSHLELDDGFENCCTPTNHRRARILSIYPERAPARTSRRHWQGKRREERREVVCLEDDAIHDE